MVESNTWPVLYAVENAKPSCPLSCPPMQVYYPTLLFLCYGRNTVGKGVGTKKVRHGAAFLAGCASVPTLLFAPRYTCLAAPLASAALL